MCSQRIDYFNLALTLLKKSPIDIFGVYALEMEGGGESWFFYFQNNGGYFETNFNVPRQCHPRYAEPSFKVFPGMLKGEYAEINTPASQAFFQHFNDIGLL